MMGMTNRAFPITDRQILSLFVDVPTDTASLRGGEVSVYLHNLFTVPFSFVCQHRNKTAPACICDRLSKTMVAFHTFDIQILNANGIISSHKGYRTLMQVVGTAISNLLVKPGNFEFLVFKPSTAFNLSGKMLLRLCKTALVYSCVSVILKSFSLGSDKQVLQPHVYADSLTCLYKRCCVFFFREYGNEILTAWCLGNSYLADFTFYLTVYTALDTLLELGYEKPATCDRCKLRDGETIFGVLGFEVRKFRTLLKEIGIGYFKTADSKLQGLRIYFFEPCSRFLLLQCGKRLSLCVIIIAFTSEPILFLTLIEKVVVHKARTSEVLCQQFGLFPIRVQSELVCPVNLSHITYKDSNYFVNTQDFTAENYKNMKKIYDFYQKVAGWLCHFEGDKYVHLIVGLVLANIMVHVGVSVIHSELLPAMFVSFIIVDFLGIAKETIDFVLRKGFDGVDMMFTWVGSALGVLLCLL